MSANVSEIIPQQSIPPAVKTGGDVVPTKMFGLDTRFVPPILITLILLVGQMFSGFLESYPQTILAILTAIVFEIVLSKFITGKFPHLASAYISGISVGILVRSPEIYWTFALCAAISITSKYVLRVKDRHLWNPSNFGISFMLFFAPFAVASLSIQWGNNLYAMMVIWLLGSVIVYRLKRFHITITYVLSFLFLSFVRSQFTGHPFLAEVAPITGAMYQLFIFFMITDPKTTVRSSKFAQCFVAFMVAFAEMLLRLTENVHAPYYALFIVGPIANLIDIWWISRKTSLEAATAD
jgi:Na+-transporting NADH:ubiquinone oxidoreductase subunit NqrB